MLGAEYNLIVLLSKMHKHKCRFTAFLRRTALVFGGAISNLKLNA
jgi:hypothetical protein